MAGYAKSIYVEIEIAAPIERVWELTQLPDLHEQWDLRFTRIEYQPQPDISQPQQFLYSTRIGFGLAITGGGETVGSHDGPDGQKSSALRFWSDDPKSLIREGSGYWKYIPIERKGGAPGVRFFTGYDYTVRFGIAGRLVDRVFFRPVIGWATAWSFDRLRLWAEKGILPAAAIRQSLIHCAVRVALALVWIYQGLIPKLIYRHPDEISMLASAGFSAHSANISCIAFGWAELVVGFALLARWRSQWPLWLTAVTMPLALLGVALKSSAFLMAAFNPVALNVAVLALAVIGLISAADLPSASRCLRRPNTSGNQ